MSLNSTNATVGFPLYMGLLNFTFSEPLASIVAINPTATTVLFGCPYADTNCTDDDMRMTVGPWATATTPPDVDAATVTGRIDVIRTARSDWVESTEGQAPTTYETAGQIMSMGCDMTSATIPIACTQPAAFVNGTNVSEFLGTYTGSSLLSSWFPFTLETLSITGGAEKLTAMTASDAAPTATATATTTTSTSAARTGSGSTSAGATTPTPTESAGPTGAGGRTGASTTRSVLACLMLASVMSCLF